MTRPAADGSNLSLVLGAWFDAVRHRDVGPLAALFGEDVVWEGPVPGSSCRGRHDVTAMLGRRVYGAQAIVRLEAIENRDHVVIAAEGAGIHVDGVAGPEGRAWLVITLRDGRVVHMRGVANRAEALALAGIVE